MKVSSRTASGHGRQVMPEHWFDGVIQAMTAGISRRETLAALGGTLPALLAARGADGRKCKKEGRKCDKNKDCCDGSKCKGGKHGRCRCKSGRKECAGNGTCQNLDNDELHCGACDVACDAGETCCGGVCCASERCCDNVCVTNLREQAHCGACDIACGEDEICDDELCRVCPPEFHVCGNGCCRVV